MLILGLTILAASFSLANVPAQTDESYGERLNATESAIDFTINDLLLGSQDPIFWFLVPLFGFISVGICTIINYAALSVTYLFYSAYDCLKARPSWVKVEEIRRVRDLGFLMVNANTSQRSIYRPWILSKFSEKATNHHLRSSLLGLDYNTLSICIHRRRSRTTNDLCSSAKAAKGNGKLLLQRLGLLT